jgi:DNA-binding transcriptional MocR family regulator
MPKWTDSRLDLVTTIGDWSSGKGPLYGRLARAILSAIESGELTAGTRLPPERPLAEALGVSRTTAVLAYRHLREKGLVESRQGSGSWVPRRAALSRPAAGNERSRSFLVDSVTRAAAEEDAGTIGLMGACLAGEGVPLAEEWQAAKAEVAALAAGTGYSPQGWPPLRRAIAAQLEARGVPTAPDEILVTNGAQQAIDLLGRLLVARNDAVVLEDPTYLGAIDVLTLAGARLVPVPVGAAGVEIGALRRAAAQSTPALVYLVPSFHNPTGCVMPAGARREVARLAESGDLAVVEDESLAELTFGAEPPPPIAAHAPRGTIFTVGSLSKLFWGGLRVGWVRGPRPLIARLTRFKVAADLSGSPLTQVLATRLLAHRDEVALARRRELRRRFERLAAALREQLPEWSWTQPQGGLTLWVRLPAPSAEELARVAPRYGVSIVPGPVHSPSHGFADRLRLPFVLEESLLDEGVARLARAWQTCRQTAGERRLGVIV